MTTKALRTQISSRSPGKGAEVGAHDAGWLGRTLDRLIEHVRTLLPIDGAAFLVVDAERRWIEPVADWFASPELREAIEPDRRRPYDPARPGLPEFALERDRPLLLPRVDAWEAAPELRAATIHTLGEERTARVWEAYRSSSVIACPVKTATGRPLGVLVVASIDPARPFGRIELRTVEVLADLAAMALERAERLEAEARRAREELLLKRASEAMSGSLELEQVYAQILRNAARLTGARKALLTRLNSRVRELGVVASLDFSQGLSERRLSPDKGTLGGVVRTRKPYMSTAADSSLWATDVGESEAIGSFMHAPIELGPRLFGILTVADDQAERFTEQDLELLVKLARSSAAAIANAIDFERERRIARALTLGFVPESLPEVPGYEAGLLYAPAANEPTGGDVYGAWRLPQGEMAILVGDVAGKGVETAALSAMARFFIEARSWDSTSPSTVLDQANAMLINRLPRDAFVTAFFGILSTKGVRYCNAGHLPPILLPADGEPMELAGHGLPLGIDSGPGYSESDLELEPGAMVFGYTDGLIEARRSGEVYGIDRLTRFVAGRARQSSLQNLVHAVHDEVTAWADGLADDAVALALRRRTP